MEHRVSPNTTHKNETILFQRLTLNGILNDQLRLNNPLRRLYLMDDIAAHNNPVISKATKVDTVR